MMVRDLARRLGGSMGVAVLALALPAAAQPPEDPIAAATVAFDEGIRLMDAGQYHEACPLLERAQRLDAGMATQFRIGECYEGAGLLASAWRNFVEVAVAAHAAGMADREKVARSRADALEPRLARLTIQIPPAVAEVPGLMVLRDGEELDRPFWGASLPVDAGTVRVEVTAPDHVPWTTEVTVAGEGTQVELDVPGDAFGVGPGTDQQPAPEPGPPIPTPDESSSLGGQAIAGIVVGSAGLVAMGVGVGVAFAAKSRWSESNDDGRCDNDVCSSEGLEIREEARDQGTIATVVFSIGAAALVGGGVLWLTAPAGETGDEEELAALRFGLAPNGLVLGGSW